MAPGSSELFETPWQVASADECNFYHTMELPGVGVVQGQWDLREGVHEYLGHHDFADERVLEIGPASGFLTFHIERAAREVVAVELPMDRGFWNAVPYENLGLARRRADAWTQSEEQFFDHIRGIRKGFWFAHRALGSRAKVFHGPSDDLPDALGEFDTALLAAVLLHTRSPVAILESVARRVTGTIIITEWHVPELGDGPVCQLVPTVDNKAWDTWWRFTPRFFTQFLEVLGFTEHRVTFHEQVADGRRVPQFTVVASRPG